jgi:FHS family Na+ dependent glucose MFS transporter 1
LLLVVFFFVFTVGMEIGFGNWIYTFSSTLHLASETGAAYLTSAFWGAFSVGRLIGIKTSSILKSQTILLTDLAGCLLAFAVLLLWPASIIALWVGTILMGLSIASIFATGIAFAEQRLSLSGKMIGWILVGGGIGAMIFPWIIGQLFERFSAHVTMPILLAGNLIALGLLVAMMLPMRKKDKEPATL